MQLNNALAHLDPDVEEHWTANGLPRMDALVAFMGGDTSITRKQVTDADPELTRDVARARLESAAVDPDEEVEDDEDQELEDDGLDELEEELDEELEDEGEGVDEAPELVEDEGEGIDVNHPEAVLELSPQEVLQDAQLCELAVVAMDHRINRKVQELEALKESIRQDNAWNEIVKRQHQRHQERNRVKPNPVRDYLKRNQETRTKKALAAQRFIEGGTTAREVSEALNPLSKLDRAMRRRKAERGSKRPQRRPLAS